MMAANRDESRCLNQIQNPKKAAGKGFMKIKETEIQKKLPENPEAFFVGEDGFEPPKV